MSTMNGEESINWGLKGDEAILWGMQGDCEWRNAWTRLIAYTWMSDENLKEAVDAPMQTMFKVSKYVPPAGLFLRLRANIKAEDGSLQEMVTPEFPKSVWAIEEGKLVEKVAYEAPGVPKDYQYNGDKVENQTNGWVDLGVNLPTDLIMTLPPKPANNEEGFIALADYQATGKTFPFTC